MIDQAAEKQMFMADFHTSVQQAVNKLVEMGAKALAEKNTLAESDKQRSVAKMSGVPSTKVDSTDGSKDRRLNGGSSPNLRSTLSLNVLFKNFGSLNLTTLDEILLKSSLNANKAHDRLDILPAGHQLIRVNGSHNLENQQPNEHELYSVVDENESSGKKQHSSDAECKIQYTMRNVNISLVNGARSDYTCDYIIDRKLATTDKMGNQNQPMTKLDERRVCKLRLRSKFFSNHSENIDGLSQSDCSNRTRLSIGNQNFCLLDDSDGPKEHLDRLFSFPVDLEAFDIRLIHKNRGARQFGHEGSESEESEKIPAKNNDEEGQNQEIFLEIKPIVDSDCLSQRLAGVQSTRPGGSPLQTVPSGPETGPTSYEASGPLEGDNKSEQDSSQNRPTSGTSPLDRNEHKNRGRDRHTSRLASFPNSVPGGHSSSANSKETSSASTNRLANSENSGNPVGLCNDATSVHISTIGQLMTPNYPNNYPNNVHCRMVIRRVSLAYCKLLLHYRDFDLALGETVTKSSTSSTDEECNGSYLQIGQTRYCNKYAMVGHKMVLDFANAGELVHSNAGSPVVDSSETGPAELLESVELVFHSGSSLSGRGFLIKYQQMLCDSQGQAADSNVRQRVGPPRGPLEVGEQKPKSLVVPMQQPDFGLALRTTTSNQIVTKAPRSHSSTAASTQRSPSHKKGPKKQTETSESGNNRRQNPSGETNKLESMKNSNNQTSQSGVGQTQLQMASTASNGLLLDPLDGSPDGSVHSQQQTSTQHDRRSSQKPALVAEASSELKHHHSHCNQVNHEMSFLLKSPKFPQQYGDNLQCLYFVRRNSSRVCYLELTFLKFDLEPDADCRFDYLELNNVRLCGALKDFGPHRTSRIYLFEETLKTIKFRTDSIGSKSGFLIKADQLECAPDGSIMRQTNTSNLSYSPATVQADTPKGNHFKASSSPGEAQVQAELQPHNRQQQNSSASKVFEYDSPLVKIAPSQTRARQEPARAPRPLDTVEGKARPLDRSRGLFQPQGVPAAATSTQCDQLLYGSEMTIKSPHWPESYANDDNLSQCKYTILRLNPARQTNGKAICQLELRFVHLRLGSGDCLEIDSHELLCGFTARNLIKYYPLAEKQTHATIRLSLGTPSPNDRPSLSSSGDLLLPSARAPLRFMIIVRQLECIDGFLAPQVELLDTMPHGPPFPPLNATTLLYAGNPTSQPGRLALSNKTLSSSSADSLDSHSRRPNVTGPNSRGLSNGVLMYSFANLSPADNQGLLSPINAPSSTNSRAGNPPNTAADDNAGRHQVQPIGLEQKQHQCLIQFSQFNGILSASNLISRMFDSVLGHKLGDECEIRVKLLPGYCQLQLTFGEFYLRPERSLAGLCLGNYVEIAGVQYCGSELANTTRTLSTSLSEQRHISLRLSLTDSHAFRSIFKQLPCQPHPLARGPITSNEAASPKQNSPSSSSPASSTSKQTSGDRNGSSGGGTKIDFREISVGGENFELDSSRLSDKSSSSKSDSESSVFIVYKVRKFQPQVCKLRLLFYKFQLKSAQELPNEEQKACKRSFLDVNNVDRLCGQIDSGSSDLVREYDWPQESDLFRISFVSDSRIEHSLFHIFGQQISNGCGSQSSSVGRRDEEQRAPISGHQQNNSSSPSTQQPGEPATVIFDEHHSPQAPTSSARDQHQVSGEVAPKQNTRQDSQGADKKGPKMLDSSSCSRIIESNEFQLASPNWPQRYDSVGVCRYLIRRPSEQICSLTLSIQSLILDLDGPNDELNQRACNKSAEDHLSIETGSPQSIDLCGLLSRPQKYTLNYERPFVLVKFVSRVNSGFGFLIDGQQNSCNHGNESPGVSQTPPTTSSGHATNQAVDKHQPTLQTSTPTPDRQQIDETEPKEAPNCNRLLTEEFSMIESENFPNFYPNDQDCFVAVRRPDESVCAVDLILSHFDLEPESSVSKMCENDFIEIDYSRFCGSYYPTNHRLRFNYFNSERDKLIRFHTNAANSATGYSIQVVQVRNCPELVTAGRSQEENREHSVETNRANQDKEVINYLPSNQRNSSQLQFVTLTRDSNTKKNRPQTSLDKQRDSDQTLCQFVYQNERQYLLSPHYDEDRRSYPNNLDCQYKIIAKGYEFCSLRLTILDLDLLEAGDQQISPDCPNDYLLIDNRRYCGAIRGQTDSAQAAGRLHASNDNNNDPRPEEDKQRVVEVPFDSNLPREIDLIFHTDGHANAGRGFRLLAEQVPCEDNSPTTSTDRPRSAGERLANEEAEFAAKVKARQTHRSRFNSLNYPKNYVSNSSNGRHMGKGAHGSRPENVPGVPMAESHGTNAMVMAEDFHRDSAPLSPSLSSTNGEQSSDHLEGQVITLKSKDFMVSKLVDSMPK